MDLFIDLEHTSSIPMYRQLYDALSKLIIGGNLLDGARLPSSRALSHQLRVSRNTVNLSYQELVASGLVVATQRRGYFVSTHAARPNKRTAAEAAAGAPTELGSEATPVFAWERRLLVPAGADLPEIDKPADWFEAPYPFVAGQVEHNKFPARAWERNLRAAMHKPHLHHSIRDDFVGDDPLLVQQIIEHILPGRGIYADSTEVLITLGSQQGLAMLARLLLNTSRSVLMEDPGYLDARHIFARSDAHIHPMPVDEHGAIIPDDMHGIDVVYTTPSHQHPTNVTMTVPRRHALLEAAARAEAVIVEDDYDSEFRYHGVPSPSLKSMDATGSVVYLGTFSKFLSPGLRLGFMVGAPALIAEARKERRYTVRHAPGQIQRAMGLFIESGDYQRTLRMTRNRMSRKFDRITEATREHLPLVHHTFPPGGVSLWANGGADLQLEPLIEAAAAEGVIVERGDIFFFAPPREHHFRIGFGAIAEAQIVPGIRRLGRILDDLV